MKQLRVGLTGGLASGKSTVGRWLAEAGCRVVDADALVAELYRPGGAGAEAIAAALGGEVLDAAGGVDHSFLAERIFGDPEARRVVERTVHPLVRARFAGLAAAAREPIVVLEATLLVEAGYGPDFDLVISVETRPELQLARAVARRMPEVEAALRLAAQGDGAARRAAADLVLENDGTLEELRARVDALLVDLERRAGE
ncbi:MAG: dephospho-CoA kinase [Thermoanaerobaculia bacterium]